uniref:NADH-ubiquinone oxidoreductase chain 6 n=1 Tax=Trimma caesiura TaxID=512329 RepID=A0A455TN86_9GOBI|nr:NADH dehydrogenase subunit 6 [Trimma caesiura]BBI37534.1 NADH dehydrogenase subunit 6 [Trimma caesiura]
MSYILLLLMTGLVLGMTVVASNPSPYFGALGVMIVSGLGCGLLVLRGDVFLSLVLFLIYLGGMLVVFAYSSALASELYPEALGSPWVGVNFLGYLLMVVGSGGYLWQEGSLIGEEKGGGFGGASEVSVVRSEFGGAALLYSSGGGMLVLSGWALLITLFVVLEVVRGGRQGALRAV